MRRSLVVCVTVVLVTSIFLLVAPTPGTHEHLRPGLFEGLRPLPLAPSSTAGRKTKTFLKGVGVKAMLQLMGWRVSYLKPEKNLEIVKEENGNDLLRYLFKKGLAGSESGASIRANPHGIFPSTQVRMKFRVRFPPNFPFQDGGKLLGFSFADRPGNHASGGEWKADGGSVRFMWRKHPTNNALCVLTAYVYHAVRKQPGTGWPQSAYNKQGPTTKAVMEVAADDAGNSVWWRRGGDIVMERNVWYEIALEVRLNTPGRADGLLYIVCTNMSTGAFHSRGVGDVYYRDESNVVLQELLLVAFFGGKSPARYAPPHNTYADFANFEFK